MLNTHENSTGKRGFEYFPMSSITGTLGNIISNFLRNSQIDFQSGLYQFEIPPARKESSFFFFHILASICCHLSVLS
jgi:hypothetical protein